MAIEGALEGENGEVLFVSADHIVEMSIFQADGVTPQDIAGWTIRLDIRTKDVSTRVLFAADGAVSGTFNADPVLNAQVVSWTVSDVDLAATTFKGDDPECRYSVKRTDDGSEQVLRFGAAVLNRTTQV